MTKPAGWFLLFVLFAIGIFVLTSNGGLIYKGITERSSDASEKLEAYRQKEQSEKERSEIDRKRIEKEKEKTKMAERAEKRRLAAKLEPHVQMLRDEGLLKKLDLEEGTAYVDARFWRAGSIDAKRAIAVVLANYRKAVEGHSWILIQDYRSGKVLAEYSQWGWTSYE